MSGRGQAGGHPLSARPFVFKPAHLCEKTGLPIGLLIG
ncbi:protein of unknown function [Azospirillum baldaniorum]|uniref:Uncharacterized protein n=1 Tax=Azospirillum baldaniorum TaxID=1064539 RepID=A0A9P1NL76_9PROT|nr:protein of unknown function [Azospirillum baldaniorum]